MKKKDKLFKELIGHFTRIGNKYNELEKKPRDYGTGDKLYPSEIHAITAIVENPGVHMAEMAKVLGVTRGAIMQIVLKLEKKDLAERYREPDNNKKVFVRLTRKGEIAYDGHVKYHLEMYSDLFSDLKKVNIKHLSSTKGFLDKMEFHLDKYLSEKK